MVVIFTIEKNTPRFVLYKSNDVKDVGDFSKIYVRNNSPLSQEDDLVLISLLEYEYLKAHCVDEN